MNVELRLPLEQSSAANSTCCLKPARAGFDVLGSFGFTGLILLLCV